MITLDASREHPAPRIDRPDREPNHTLRYVAIAVLAFGCVFALLALALGAS